MGLGITTDGVKVPLGLWDGHTENATIATAVLANLVERGLDTSQGVLCVLDGSKALRRAVRDVLGADTPVQLRPSQERNLLDHLPERDRPAVKRRCARPGSSTITPPRANVCRRWPVSWKAPTPCGRLSAGGPGGDAHRHAPGRARRPQEDARIDEPV